MQQHVIAETKHGHGCKHGKCKNARKWHTYATLVLSNTEKISRIPHNIHPKTQNIWRSENAFGLDVSSETLIFKMQQHVIENTEHGHGFLLQTQKRTKVAYVCHFRAFQDSHGMRPRAKVLKTYGFLSVFDQVWGAKKNSCELGCGMRGPAL